MSQYGEHQVILDHFKGRVGRFLDIGAFDGVTNSNTRQLAEAGWTGVCVEPSPPAFCLLMQNYHGNDRVTLVNAAVGEGNPLERFHVNSENGTHCDQVSTLSTQHMDKWEGFPFTTVITPVVSVYQLFMGLHMLIVDTRFDFVNIDVEGVNDEVLHGFLGVGMLAHQPELMCVELDPEEAILDMARPYKNQRVGGNLLIWGQDAL